MALLTLFFVIDAVKKGQIKATVISLGLAFIVLAPNPAAVSHSGAQNLLLLLLLLLFAETSNAAAAAAAAAAVSPPHAAAMQEYTYKETMRGGQTHTHKAAHTHTGKQRMD